MNRLPTWFLAIALSTGAAEWLLLGSNLGPANCLVEDCSLWVLAAAFVPLLMGVGAALLWTRAQGRATWETGLLFAVAAVMPLAIAVSASDGDWGVISGLMILAAGIPLVLAAIMLVSALANRIGPRRGSSAGDGEAG